MKKRKLKFVLALVGIGILAVTGAIVGGCHKYAHWYYRGLKVKVQTWQKIKILLECLCEVKDEVQSKSWKCSQP